LFWCWGDDDFMYVSLLELSSLHNPWAQRLLALVREHWGVEMDSTTAAIEPFRKTTLNCAWVMLLTRSPFSTTPRLASLLGKAKPIFHKLNALLPLSSIAL
jgi:hypothetical protein